MNKDNEIIKRLDYALTMLIGIDKVDDIYDAKDDQEVENIILELGGR